MFIYSGLEKNKGPLCLQDKTRGKERGFLVMRGGGARLLADPGGINSNLNYFILLTLLNSFLHLLYKIIAFMLFDYYILVCIYLY